jgi:DNA-binding transcriptional regulator YhcF (GntR family)
MLSGMSDSRTPGAADISHCSGVLDDTVAQLGAHALEPAYQRIAADLRAAIGAGRLQPGDWLPTERDHARRYQVAVGTYRHALATLRQEGWITTHKRHGTVVVQREANLGRGCDDLERRVARIERQVRQLAQQMGQANRGPAVATDGPLYASQAKCVSIRNPPFHAQTDGTRPWLDMPRAAAGEQQPTGLWVGLLGPVVVVGPHGPIGGLQADLVVALALASPGGLPISTVQATLGQGPKQPRSGESVRQLISRARRQLGPAPDGRDWIQRQGSGHSHLYRLHDTAVLDWARFFPLAERGIRMRNREDLAAALALVRGEPFTGYSRWWLGTPLIETIRATAIHAAAAFSAWEVAPQAR